MYENMTLNQPSSRPTKVFNELMCYCPTLDTLRLVSVRLYASKHRWATWTKVHTTLNECSVSSGDFRFGYWSDTHEKGENVLLLHFFVKFSPAFLRRIFTESSSPSKRGRLRTCIRFHWKFPREWSSDWVAQLNLHITCTAWHDMIYWRSSVQQSIPSHLDHRQIGTIRKIASWTFNFYARISCVARQTRLLWQCTMKCSHSSQQYDIASHKAAAHTS